MLQIISGILGDTISSGFPIMLCSLGCLFCARAGIINFAMEGIMTMGAFFAVFGSYLTGNPWVGLVFGIIAGVLSSLILGVMAVSVKVNQVVVGAGLNSLCLGLSSFLITVLYPNGMPAHVQGFKYPFKAMAVSKLPIIGAFTSQQLLTYIGFALVPVVFFVIFKTSFGMALRACGDQPYAADSLGISVTKKRYIAVLISGILGGAGGAALSLGQMSMFTVGMVSGRGYMAWSAVTIGRYGPVGVMLASLLFGAASSLQSRMKLLGIPIPSQFFSMLPYVLTMVVLASVVGRTVGMRYIGKPFIKGER